MSDDALRGDESAVAAHRGYDAAERRRAKRSGRERGCWTYIPAEALERAGFNPGEPAPLYRVWSGPRGRVVVQLYRATARDDERARVRDSQHRKPA